MFNEFKRAVGLYIVHFYKFPVLLLIVGGNERGCDRRWTERSCEAVCSTVFVNVHVLPPACEKHPPASCSRLF